VANGLIFFGMITILAGSLTSFSDKIVAKEPLNLDVWVNWGFVFDYNDDDDDD